MEKKMENEMETREYVGIIRYCKGLGFKVYKDPRPNLSG